MFWPVVLIVIVANSVIGGIVYDQGNPTGYQTKAECDATLPEVLAAAKQMPWPLPLNELAMASGCIDTPPLEFYKKHIQPESEGRKA